MDLGPVSSSTADPRRNEIITEAILARSVAYGESDRICTLLTPELGKISVIARGARSSRKRYGAALEFFVKGRATLKPRRKGSELYPLAEFEGIDDRGRAIGVDLAKFAHGSYVLELARELWPPEQADVRLFDLVWQSLSLIAEQPASAQLLRAYESQLLVICGFAPLLEQCVRCARAIDCGNSQVGFSVSLGGVVCSGCGPSGWPLSPSGHLQLVGFAQRPFDESARLHDGGEAAAEVRDILSMILRHHLGKSIQTVEFIDQLTASRQPE